MEILAGVIAVGMLAIVSVVFVMELFYDECENVDKDYCDKQVNF